MGCTHPAVVRLASAYTKGTPSRGFRIGSSTRDFAHSFRSFRVELRQLLLERLPWRQITAAHANHPAACVHPCPIIAIFLFRNCDVLLAIPDVAVSYTFYHSHEIRQQWRYICTKRRQKEYKETTKRITGRIQPWPWHAPQKSAKVAVQQRQQHNASGKEFKEAAVPVRSAVQLNDVSAAGLVMQAVHVLGYERLQPAA